MVTKTKTCVHYWHCEEARGVTSKAECIHCHQKAEFVNIVDPEFLKVVKVRQGNPEYDYYTMPESVE